MASSISNLRNCAKTLVSCSLLFTDICIAQRGSQPKETTAKPWDATAQGFPGYFDTHVAKPRSLVVEFPPMIYGVLPTPSTAVDYGVSETLTVGTNAIVTAVPWFFGARGLSLKLRTLLYGNESQQSAATYYAGYLSSNGTSNFIANYHTINWNHAWRPARSHTLTAHGNYHRLNLELEAIDSLNHTVIHLTTLLLGGGYDFELTKRWSFRGDVLASIYQNLEADTAVASIDLSSSLTKTKAATATMTAQVQYHPFDKWLFGLGATGISFGGVTGALPWFTWSKRW